ncbi:MAG: hypothetical protein PWR06_106 [Thermoanaerobacteraceae bacterium]|nr:hypothetical protein [Thermoanaerobacteraceae bacterium]
MVDSIRYNDWLEKAERDIKAARVLKQNDCGNDIVAFHCQQAIEKALNSRNNDFFSRANSGK